eukprot:Amastigsp_a848896_8.p2 type:complete len:168 gc:universal Amastigsp_a848896_8:242-745(+)
MAQCAPLLLSPGHGTQPLGSHSSTTAANRTTVTRSVPATSLMFTRSFWAHPEQSSTATKETPRPSSRPGASATPCSSKRWPKRTPASATATPTCGLVHGCCSTLRISRALPTRTQRGGFCWSTWRCRAWCCSSTQRITTVSSQPRGSAQTASARSGQRQRAKCPSRP